MQEQEPVTGGDVTLRVAAAQFALDGSIEENRQAGLAQVGVAAGRGADLVCLPELFPIPYFAVPGYRGTVPEPEPLDGPTIEALAALASDRRIWILTGLYERSDSGAGHNSAVLIDRQGAVRQVFRKLHIPDLPWNIESEYFTPGDEVVTADVDGLRLGVSICYDRHFPEVSRLATLGGAQAIVFPTASRSRPGRDRIYAAEVMTRAAENNVYALGINRVGDEGYGVFFGGSVAAGPDGEVQAQLGTEPGLLETEWSTRTVREAAETFRQLLDLRPDLVRALGTSMDTPWSG